MSHCNGDVLVSLKSVEVRQGMEGREVLLTLPVEWRTGWRRVEEAARERALGAFDSAVQQEAPTRPEIEAARLASARLASAGKGLRDLDRALKKARLTLETALDQSLADLAKVSMLRKSVADAEESLRDAHASYELVTVRDREALDHAQLALPSELAMSVTDRLRAEYQAEAAAALARISASATGETAGKLGLDVTAWLVARAAFTLMEWTTLEIRARRVVLQLLGLPVAAVPEALPAVEAGSSWWAGEIVATPTTPAPDGPWWQGDVTLTETQEAEAATAAQ